jgi:uncharacterized protein DUF4190/uncharacterized protein DUF2510
MSSAGWYPDPSDGTHDRYWDGTTWTEHRHPRAVPAYPAPAPPNHGPATTSLVLGILSLALCGFFTGIPAIIIGRRAGREIDASGGRLGGRGVATAGFVTGLLGTLWSGVSFLIVVAVFVFGSAFSASFEDTCSTVGTYPTSSTC